MGVDIGFPQGKHLLVLFKKKKGHGIQLSLERYSRSRWLTLLNQQLKKDPVRTEELQQIDFQMITILEKLSTRKQELEPVKSPCKEVVHPLNTGMLHHQRKMLEVSPKLLEAILLTRKVLTQTCTNLLIQQLEAIMLNKVKKILSEKLILIQQSINLWDQLSLLLANRVKETL